MKMMTRWSWGIFLSLIILFGAGSLTRKDTVLADGICSTSPISSVSQMLDLASQEQWSQYLKELTGDTPVMIAGQLRTIDTRYSDSLFNGSADALAFSYIKEQLASMQYTPNTEVNHYGYLEHNYDYNGKTWKNLILTVPGQEQVDPKKLILSAHLDNLPEENAPGAVDNGVGAVALLEIARVIRYYQFDATLKLIWFTGEEQGMRGSLAYVNNFGSPFFDDLLGVINLDMFGYDADGDDCFEIHAGDKSNSFVLGDCLVNTIQAYSLPLNFDYIKMEVPGALSDHRPFWNEGVGAIEILENHFTRQESDDYHQCEDTVDGNPHYHTLGDTISNSVDIPFAFNIVKASLATAAVLSKPQGACFETPPTLTLNPVDPFVHLNWQNLGWYVTYRLYRSENGCGGSWQELAEDLYTTEYIDGIKPSPDLAYRLEAIDSIDMCISLPSNCVSPSNIERIKKYIPLVIK